MNPGSLSCQIILNKNKSVSLKSKAVPRIATIRELIVDDQQLYRIVRNHVFNCNKCDPIIVLQTYLNRRKNKLKFNGFTSATLVKLMMQYNNLMIKRDGKSLPENLKREFIWRSGHAGTLI